jgi:hypothetical protein
MAKWTIFFTCHANGESRDGNAASNDEAHYAHACPGYGRTTRGAHAGAKSATCPAAQAMVASADEHATSMGNDAAARHAGRRIASFTHDAARSHVPAGAGSASIWLFRCNAHGAGACDDLPAIWSHAASLSDGSASAGHGAHDADDVSPAMESNGGIAPTLAHACSGATGPCRHDAAHACHDVLPAGNGTDSARTDVWSACCATRGCCSNALVYALDGSLSADGATSGGNARHVN